MWYFMKTRSPFLNVSIRNCLTSEIDKESIKNVPDIVNHMVRPKIGLHVVKLKAGDITNSVTFR